MRKALFTVLCLALAACMTLLPGCRNPAQDEGQLELWFVVDQSQRGAPAAALATQPYQGEATLPALMEALMAGPEGDSSLRSPIPQGTQLLDWTVENQVAHINLSQPYGDLVGIRRTLANYAITLTLAQLAEVEGVEITVNSSLEGGTAGQVFYPSDVVFSGVEEEPVELSAALYFRRAGTQELGYELRVFQITEESDAAGTVLTALLAGPQDSGLEPLLPQGLEVRSVRMDAQVCYVDLSAALLQAVPASREEQELVIDSLVNTLCSLDSVSGVQLLVEGEELTAYGQLTWTGPLSGDV